MHLKVIHRYYRYKYEHVNKDFKNVSQKGTDFK